MKKLLLALAVAFFITTGLAFCQEAGDTLKKSLPDTINPVLPDSANIKVQDDLKKIMKKKDHSDNEPEISNRGKGWGLSLKASTLGFGLEVIRRQNQFFTFRLGGTYFPWERRNTDVEFEVEKTYTANFSAVTLIADWFVIGHFSTFHLSGGFVYNKSNLKVDGIPSNTYTIGSYTIPPEQIGDISIRLTPNKFSPYLGAGFGSFISNKKRLTFNVQLGILYQGPPEVEFNATGMIEPTAEQIEIVARNMEGFIFYPVLDLQIVYRLNRIK
jgi:hypothetical protein